MPDKKPFDALHKGTTKHEARMEKYILQKNQEFKPKIEEEPSFRQSADEKIGEVQQSVHSRKYSQISGESKETSSQKLLRERNEVIERYATFAEQPAPEKPKICLSGYLSQDETEKLLQISNKKMLRKNIEQNLEEYPKGTGRLLLIELMYTVVRFCQKCKFSTVQSGAILSFFYLTHKFFLNSLYTTPNQTYTYFKEYLLLHSFESPPDSMQFFNYKESTYIIQFFCRMYIQNLPLIRMLALPNYGFYFDFERKLDLIDELLMKPAPGKGKKK